MTTITAKARVERLEELEQNGELDAVVVHMNADYGTEAQPINQAWSRWTPSLGIHISVKPELADQFPLNGKFTVSFELDQESADPTAPATTPGNADTAPAGGETLPSSEPAGSIPSPAPAAVVAEAEAVDPTVIAPTTVDHNSGSEDQALAAVAEPIAPNTVDH